MDELEKLRVQMSRAFQLNRREANLISEWALTTEVMPADRALLARVTAAYRATGAKFEAAGDSQWFTFMKENLDAHVALVKDDWSLLIRMFAAPGKTNLFKGFDGIYIDGLKWAESDSNAKPWLALFTYDNLVRLAEAVGAAPIENPETYSWIEPRSTPVEEILERLDSAFGFHVDFPNPYPDEIGIASSRGVISYRAPQALFQAWRISQLLKERGGSRVAEIGAGLGRTAYYARKFGVDDYTIVDLPFSNVSQAHFLGTTLGPDAITLTGEPTRAGTIKIATGDDFLGGSDTFDLVINVDSFTEIDRGIAQAYWRAIEARSPLFVSINHEHNPMTVREFIGERRSTRTPYWMRRGYVEEVVEFGHVDQSAYIANLERTVDALRKSTSWRVTAPLRKISGFFR